MPQGKALGSPRPKCKHGNENLKLTEEAAAPKYLGLPMSCDLGHDCDLAFARHDVNEAEMRLCNRHSASCVDIPQH